MHAFLALLLAGAAAAQAPDDPWRTVETEHYRVHYPAQAEAWALDAASRLDGLRAQLVDEVGYAPRRRVDVLVMDPYTTSNGSAWPFLRHPRMVLWVTPPEASSILSNYRSWSELVLLHEDAHLVHLLRPARGPLDGALDALMGIGPISRKAPRWVIEGYATVLEARYTGWGRPTSDVRAQWLRELARQGRMPTYGQLDGSDRFLGGSYAYLVGSSFLEWVEARGPGRLSDVWARLTARRFRNFDTAFAGVFGDRPAALYDRFVAETTHAALEIERARRVEEGTLFLDLSRGTGAPAVSPDGERLAAVVRFAEDPPRLRVWSTAIDEEALADRAEDIDEMLAADPEDVAPVAPEAPPVKRLAEREHATRAPVGPRWTRDGALLFASWTLDAEGRGRPDLYLWHPDTGRERRVTRGADVRSADPAPDADRAVAVQHDWGRTRLVWVDLDSGAVEPLTDWSLEIVVDQPRLSTDGARLAWLENAGAGWDVVVRDLDDGSEERIAAGGPDGPTYADLAWTTDGRLLASVGRDGFVEIEAIAPDGSGERLTRTHGGAWAPAPTPDGDALFFLSFDDEGFDVHRWPTAWPEAGDAGEVDEGEAEDGEVADGEAGDGEAGGPRALGHEVEPPEVDPTLPVLPAVVDEVPPAPRRALPAPRRYGLGRTEWRPLVGGALTADQQAIELGLRAGDVVGRHELLLMASYGGEPGVTGALLGGTLRVLPVEPVLQAFVVSEGTELMDRAGAALRVDHDRRWQDARMGLGLGGWVDAPLDRVDDDPGLLDPDALPGGGVLTAAPERAVGWAAASLAVREPRTAAVGGGLSGFGQLGRTGDEGWWRAEGTATLWFGRTFRVLGAYTYGTSDTSWGIDRYRLGGAPTSVLPQEWSQQRVHAPWFDPGLLRGQDRDAVRVAAGAPEAVLVFAERHRMGDHGLPGGGATFVGVGSDLRFDPVPLARIPASRLGFGLGCLVEDPDAGWADEPCQELSDWSGWLHVNWHL